MASRLYTKFVESYETQEGNMVDLVTDTIKVVLVDSLDYIPNTSADEFLSDIPSAGRVATGTLAGKSVTNRVFDANDLIISGVTGDRFEYVVLYRDTGSEMTSRLIVLIDSATGLPFTPTGGGIKIEWDNGANKIFKL